MSKSKSATSKSFEDFKTKSESVKNTEAIPRKFEEVKNDTGKVSGGLKSGEELDRKLQETVEMLLERRKKKDAEWQRSMKQKTHNALAAFQGSNATEGKSSSLPSHISFKGNKDSVLGTDHSYFSEGVMGKQARKENPEARKTSSGADGKKANKTKMAKSLPKKMTSILNLTKFNSIINC